MRRLRRAIVISLMLISLGLAVITGVLWARSYSRLDDFFFAKAGFLFASASSEKGEAEFELIFRFPDSEASHYSYEASLLPFTDRILPRLRTDISRGEVVEKRFDRCGIAYFSGRAHAEIWPYHGVIWDYRISTRHETAGRMNDIGRAFVAFSDPLPYQRLRLPHYVLMILFAVPPMLFFVLVIKRERLRKHRLAEGLCVNCGYDLRASPGKCPECGTIRLPVAQF